jgi:HEAT repeats
MQFKKPLEKIGVKPVIRGTVPNVLDKSTSGLLQSALATFPTDRVSAICAIQRLQSSDPAGLAQAAVQLLFSAKEPSPGLQHVAGLKGAGNLVADLLMNEQVIPLEAAMTLVRKLVGFDARLDVRLVQRTIAKAADGVGSIIDTEALRMLQLVDEISDCALLSSSLIQFLRHPSKKVHSKAALMLGRSNWNPDRMESLLASENGRLRANAVESLWGHRHQGIEEILWAATQDSCARVVANALFGLCLLGDSEAYLQLAGLADTPDPVLRRSAAWAMGENGDPQFDEALQKLEQDADANVREVAQKSRKKLRAQEPVQLPTDLAVTLDQSTAEADESAKEAATEASWEAARQRGLSYERIG